MAAIIGSIGKDTLIGTAGNDTIFGMGGADTLSGGAGNDAFVFQGSVPNLPDTSSIIDGGNDYDTIDLHGWTAELYVAERYETRPAGTPGAPRVELDIVQRAPNVSAGVATAFSIEKIIFGNYNVTLDLGLASTGDPKTAGGIVAILDGPTNYVRITRSNDTILAGGGDDMLEYQGGSVQASLGEGTNTVTIHQLSGYSDHSSLSVGAGIDWFIVDATAMADGATVDLAIGSAMVANASFSLSGFDNILLGRPFFSSLSFAPAAFGTDGVNHIRIDTPLGTTAAILDGRGGDDWLESGDGGEILYGGAGNNVISAGEGADWVNGGGRHSGDPWSGTIVNSGNDTLFGDGGNDHIFGNSQAAQQGALDGDDRIDGGYGSDYANGNAGNDTIYGGAGSDRLYGGSGNDEVWGDAPADSATGTPGNDHLNGNKGNDTLHGGDANDDVHGGQDADLLMGEEGSDTLSGDAGNDTLIGGTGQDWLSGGAGADSFRSGIFDGPTAVGPGAPLPDAATADTIIDFQHGIDRIEIGLAPVSILVGNASSAGNVVTVAQALMGEHAGDHEVAAVAVGGDTYLVYAVDGSENITTAIRIQNSLPADFTLHDF